MAIALLSDWLNEFDGPGSLWYVKRLSANDTLRNGSHQAGPYIPRNTMFRAFPSLNRIDVSNPDEWFDLYIDSHSDYQRARAVYYNSKPRGEGTRNETRMTGFGGEKSALLNADSTGALTVFAFRQAECHVWLCEHATEEDVIEERIGAVEPDQFTLWDPVTGRENVSFRGPGPAVEQIPAEWLNAFPSGEQIIARSVEACECYGLSADLRLLRRRRYEYELFQRVEEAAYLPRIQTGFSKVEPFLALAQTMLQSRKARAGNSLELHVRQIFVEEGLRPGVDFAPGPVSENGKRPDFLFPSQDAYHDPCFPDSNLRMLAVKTTCKDRWRQILNEADRVRTKHLLTLQEGVSEGQFLEMCQAGVALVVPAELHERYPRAIRSHLLTLESFIAEIRLLSLSCQMASSSSSSSCF